MISITVCHRNEPNGIQQLQFAVADFDPSYTETPAHHYNVADLSTLYKKLHHNVYASQ